MELEKFQEHFSKFLYEKRPDLSFNQWIEQKIHKNNFQNGLGVYRNNLIVTLTQALSESYPCAKKILSDELFLSLAKDFAYSFPSKVHDLNSYGVNFPKYIRNNLEHRYSEAVYDLMRLELFWEECDFLKEDQPLSNEKAIALLDSYGDELVLKLRDSARTFSSKFNVFDIWVSINDGLEKTIEDFFDSGSSQYFLIWKNGFNKNICKIEPALYPIIQCIHKSLSLGEISKADFIKDKGHKSLIECLQVLINKQWVSYL